MRMEYHAEFACTPEKLWPFLEEPEKQKLWMKGLLENRLTSDGPARPGSTFAMKIKEGGSVSDYAGEITALERPRHLGIRFWGGCFPNNTVMRVDYRLADLRGRTRLDYVAEMEGGQMGFFMRLMMPLFKLFGRLQLRSFMRTLKKLAEAPG
jgi:uncharacterized protein YndB with AHSA1/START domain